MKKYLVTGEAIDKLFQEERIRRERGDIIFTPLPEDFEYKEDSTEDVAPEVVGELPKSPILDFPYEPLAEDPEPKAEENSEEEPAHEETAEEHADDKTPEIEDIKEVDIDADVKEVPADDNKEVSEADVKEAAPAKKTTKRSKKTE